MSALEINAGQLGIRYLVDGSQSASLGTFEAQYFRDVAAVVNAGGPPDKATLVAVMTRYGLVPLTPK